ncbi:unnamed protein product [Arctogadus glacialis]
MWDLGSITHPPSPERKEEEEEAEEKEKEKCVVVVALMVMVSLSGKESEEEWLGVVVVVVSLFEEGGGDVARGSPRDDTETPTLGVVRGRVVIPVLPSENPLLEFSISDPLPWMTAAAAVVMAALEGHLRSQTWRLGYPPDACALRPSVSGAGSVWVFPVVKRVPGTRNGTWRLP